MIRQVTLVLLVGLIPGSACAAADETAPMKAFSSVRIQLNEDLNTLKESKRGEDGSFNPHDVNAVVDRVRTGALAKVPQNDFPLITYITAHLPKPIDNTVESIDKDDAENIFRILERLLDKLSNMPAFTVNVTVTTKPDKAQFDLIPAIGDKISTTTDDTLTNIYRGSYSYSVNKRGFKAIESEVNFIERAGDQIDCQLVPDNDPQGSLPCRVR